MSPPRRPRRSRRRSRSGRRALILGGLLLLGLGIALGIWWGRPPARPDLDGMLETPGPTEEPGKSDGRVDGEPGSGRAVEPVPSEADRPAPAPSPPSPAGHRAGTIAIVIDDLGRSVEDVETLAGLGIPLTYAVLPYESRTPEVVAELQRRGVEIFLHLPMEAAGGANPGPGALLLGMSADELREGTRRALRAVPGAVGVNNHMGSGMSAEPSAMRPVLEVISGAGLEFLDSRTSPETVGYEEALRLGIPTGERDVFLDVERTPEFIRGQFEELLDRARRHGSAIAIGHPHRVTIETLAELVPEAKAQGFDFVTVSELLEG